MSREELENYKKIKLELEEFCANFVNKLYEVDNTLCYSYVYDSRIHIGDDTLYITTYRLSYGNYEAKTKIVKVPLQVIYENKVDEYIMEIKNTVNRTFSSNQ